MPLVTDSDELIFKKNESIMVLADISDKIINDFKIVLIEYPKLNKTAPIIIVNLKSAKETLEKLKLTITKFPLSTTLMPIQVFKNEISNLNINVVLLADINKQQELFLYMIPLNNLVIEKG